MKEMIKNKLDEYLEFDSDILIQLIRPSGGLKDFSNYEEGFRDLISNVDLSCCGVSYDGKEIHEDFPNAIVHCQSKVFKVKRV